MMQVTNPQEPFMNLPQEDVFVAVNDMGVQHGYGYVMYQFRTSRSISSFLWTARPRRSI